MRKLWLRAEAAGGSCVTKAVAAGGSKAAILTEPCATPALAPMAVDPGEDKHIAAAMRAASSAAQAEGLSGFMQAIAAGEAKDAYLAEHGTAQAPKASTAQVGTRVQKTCKGLSEENVAYMVF